MGLLDMLGGLSPEQTQGLLAAAAQISEASGPARVKPNVMGALAQGGLAYSQSTEQARQRKLMEERQAQQDQMAQASSAQNNELRGMQIQGLKGSQAEAARDVQKQAALSEAARASYAGGQFDQKGYIEKVMQIDPEYGTKLIKDLAPKPVTYSTSATEVTGPDGRPMLVQIASDGSDPRPLKGMRPYHASTAAGGGGGGAGGGVGAIGKEGKPPAGYRWTATSELEAIPGGPASLQAKLAKAPTEFQGKSGIFGMRAEEADKTIRSLQGKYSPSAVNSKVAVQDTWLVGGIAGAAVNKFAMSDNDQKAEQAQRDFVNAVLRQESGAAIGKDEFDNARRQYFPQPGDSKAVIDQKARNRQLAVQGLNTNAGPARMTAPAQPAQAGGWSITKVN